jgi:hypothetical protein
LFAGSTRIFAAACFSEFAIAALHNLFDFIRYHFFYLFGVLARISKPSEATVSNEIPNQWLLETFHGFDKTDQVRGRLSLAVESVRKVGSIRDMCQIRNSWKLGF